MYEHVQTFQNNNTLYAHYRHMQGYMQALISFLDDRLTRTEQPQWSGGVDPTFFRKQRSTPHSQNLATDVSQNKALQVLHLQMSSKLHQSLKDKLTAPTFMFAGRINRVTLLDSQICKIPYTYNNQSWEA